MGDVIDPQPSLPVAKRPELTRPHLTVGLISHRTTLPGARGIAHTPLGSNSALDRPPSRTVCEPRAAAISSWPTVWPFYVANSWRYRAAVPTDTATIRVTRETRDLLARQASERGLSLSAMLADLAREVIFRAERAATRADAVETEEPGWGMTLGDGID